ncbi:MAG: hypothetical protein HYU66_26160, partial [Armatimonadetes bacterium]|nr:hypothetical protein [Armatimonadota bacterium]
FEAGSLWTGRTYPESVPGKVELVASPHYQGKQCLRMEYDFTTTDETRAVYADYKREIGTPKAVSVWVYGDGKGHWLRGSFRDKAGQVHDVDFTDYVNWDHYWARCTAVLPAGIQGPITWQEFHLVQHRPEVKSAGVIFLDEFEGIY